MKKFVCVTLLALAMILSLGPAVTLAQEEGSEAKAPVSIDVEIVGVPYCLLETLAKDEVADANSTFAGINALKVTEAADLDGNAIEGMAGKTLQIVPNAAGEALFVGEQHRGKTVTILGRLFKNENAIVVEEFESEGGDDAWDALPTGSKSGLQVL